MKVRELIQILQNFPPEVEVRVGVSWPDRVSETYDRFWVGDYGGGPQLNAALDFPGLRIYVGCTFPQPRGQSGPAIDLGHYDSVEAAAKVRDFYVVNKGLSEPLNYPQFDYDTWIPPRTTSGQYNPHIAEILREKLMRE